MRRVWLIRAGDVSEELDAMRRAGLIGVRYETVGDVRQLTPDEIDEGIAQDGRGPGSASRRSILLSFANDMRPGDIIVSPNAARHEVWVGKVAGEYQHTDAPVVPRYGHTRQVDWLGWLDRDAAWMRDQLTSFERPLIMFELASREWWIRQTDSRDFGAAPRVTWASTTRASTRAPRTPTERTPRAKAAPKPSTRKVPVPLVRCAGSCGFQWAPTSLVGGFCADCRAD